MNGAVVAARRRAGGNGASYFHSAHFFVYRHLGLDLLSRLDVEPLPNMTLQRRNGISSNALAAHVSGGDEFCLVISQN